MIMIAMNKATYYCNNDAFTTTTTTTTEDKYSNTKYDNHDQSDTAITEDNKDYEEKRFIHLTKISLFISEYDSYE